MQDREFKLNIMVEGDRVFEKVYPDYASMMDAARNELDSVVASHPGSFVVAQSQSLGEFGWVHHAVMS